MEVAHIDVWRRDPERFWRFYGQRFAMLATRSPTARTARSWSSSARGAARGGGHAEHRRPARAAGHARPDRGPRLDRGRRRAWRAARRYPLDEARARLGAAADGVPRCDCGAPLKPDVVLFGELLPEAALGAGLGAGREGRPAALRRLVARGLPGGAAARRSRCGAGGALALVTQGPTPYDDDAAVKLDGDVVEELEARRSRRCWTVAHGSTAAAALAHGDTPLRARLLDAAAQPARRRAASTRVRTRPAVRARSAASSRPSARSTTARPARPARPPARPRRGATSSASARSSSSRSACRRSSRQPASSAQRRARARPRAAAPPRGRGRGRGPARARSASSSHAERDVARRRAARRSAPAAAAPASRRDARRGGRQLARRRSSALGDLLAGAVADARDERVRGARPRRRTGRRRRCGARAARG